MSVRPTPARQPSGVSAQRRFPLRGYLFLVATAFFTALSYVFGRLVDKTINPETVTFFWFFGAFLFAMMATVFLKGQRAELRSLGRYLPIFLLSSVITSVGAALWVTSLRSIGLPLTSFLMKAQTVFSLLLGVLFLGERLNRGEAAGIAITIVGGVVVAYEPTFALLAGSLTALAAAFCYSLLSFVVKRMGARLNMLTVANLRALGVSMVTVLYLVATGRFVTPRPLDLLYMLLGGLTGAYIAKASQFQSIKLLDVSRSTAVMPLESLFVIVFSYLLFHELPPVAKLLGGGAIVLGVVFLVWFRGEKPDVLAK